MSKHIQAKRELERAREEYQKAVTNGDTHTIKRATAAVRARQDALAGAIADGANPCPFCKVMPHGMEQPHVVNNVECGVEFEVGCLACKPFVWSDGTTRKVSVRGGLIPRQTVEAWNEGPDYWTISKKR